MSRMGQSSSTYKGIQVRRKNEFQRIYEKRIHFKFGQLCGYIGTAKNGGNQGRYGDIHDRVYHLDDMEYTED